MRLTEFLEEFFHADESMFIFGYSPKELPEADKEMPVKIETTRNKLASDLNLQAKLKGINRTQGLYFTVNAGGTLKEEITRINAVFCEIDDLPMQTQHDIFDNAELPPSIRVETKKSVHAYWLLAEPISIDDFIFLQRGLIERFKSDKSIKNQNRVMRLPFFNHVSFANGQFLHKSVMIHTFNSTRFNFAELKEFYSPSPDKPIPTFEKTTGDEWQEVFDELRRRVRSLPTYHREQGGRLASAQGICHHGETNRTLVENLETGKIFCRNECSFDEILSAFGIERPKKKEKRFHIPRVSPPVQKSDLYKWLTEKSYAN